MIRQDVQTSAKKVRDKIMLDTMQIDSKYWAKLEDDPEEPMKVTNLFPPAVFNNADYIEKLQNLAFFAE